MPDNLNELAFSFWGMALSAKGAVTYLVGVAVSLLIAAMAWRLVRR